MVFHAAIDILPLPALLDPQGKAVSNTLPNMGLGQLTNVRIGTETIREKDHGAVVQRDHKPVTESSPNQIGRGIHCADAVQLHEILNQPLINVQSSQGSARARSSYKSQVLEPKWLATPPWFFPALGSPGRILQCMGQPREARRTLSG